MEVFRASPRQADLMIVAGRVSQKMAPVLRQIYDQMAEPKWVLAMGVCASSGGMFNNYAIVQGVDHVVPVDMYLPGCPPRPEMLIDAILKLHDQIQAHQARRQPPGADRRARDRRRSTRCRPPRCRGTAAVSDEHDPTEQPARPRTHPPSPTETRLPAAPRPSARPRGRRHPRGHVRRPRQRRHLRLRRPRAGRSPCPAAPPPPYGGWFDEVAEALVQGWPSRVSPDAVEKVVVHRGEITFFIRRERLLEHRAAAARRRRRCASRCASGVSGVHYPDEQGRELHAVYHLLSITHNRRIRLEVTCPDADPHIPSVVAVYPTNDWHERETYDFFGIIFDGHPALTRIEMPDDWPGHPQRKDYPLGGIPVEYKGATIPPPDKRRSYS